MIETYKYISGHYDVKPVLNMVTYGKTRGHKANIFIERYKNKLPESTSTVSELHTHGNNFQRM